MATKKATDHIIKVGADCWGEAETKVEAYFKRTKEPRPVMVMIGKVQAYRVTASTEPKRTKTKWGLE